MYRLGPIVFGYHFQSFVNNRSPDPALTGNHYITNYKINNVQNGLYLVVINSSHDNFWSDH